MFQFLHDIFFNLFSRILYTSLLLCFANLSTWALCLCYLAYVIKYSCISSSSRTTTTTRWITVEKKEFVWNKNININYHAKHNYMLCCFFYSFFSFYLLGRKGGVYVSINYHIIYVLCTFMQMDLTYKLNNTFPYFQLINI